MIDRVEKVEGDYHPEKAMGFGYVKEITGKIVKLGFIGSQTLRIRTKHSLNLGDFIQYRVKDEEKIFGNITDIVKEIQQIKSVIADLNYLESTTKATKNIGELKVGSAVTLTVKQVKKYGVIGNIENNKHLVGFIQSDNLEGSDTQEEGSSIDCVILNIDTEKMMADLLPVSESKQKTTSRTIKELISENKAVEYDLVLKKDSYWVFCHPKNKFVIGITRPMVEELENESINGFNVIERNVLEGGNNIHRFLILQPQEEYERIHKNDKKNKKKTEPKKTVELVEEESDSDEEMKEDIVKVEPKENLQELLEDQSDDSEAKAFVTQQYKEDSSDLSGDEEVKH